jgi:plastocyanin
MPTTVNIESSPGTRVPDPSQVTVVAGDTVTFAADDSSSSLLFVSSAAAAILSPTPVSPVTIDPGAPVTFTFLQSVTGTVCAGVAPPDVSSTDLPECTNVGNGILLILPGTDSGFDDSDVKTGN